MGECWRGNCRRFMIWNIPRLKMEGWSHGRQWFIDEIDTCESLQAVDDRGGSELESQLCQG